MITDLDILEAQAKILSVAPVFDEMTARDMIMVLGDDLAKGASESGGQALSNLGFSGLLTRHGDVWRISDAVRYEMVSDLRDKQPKVYSRAVSLFVSHAQNGSAQVYEKALGKQAAKLAVASLQLVITDDEETAFENVVRQVQLGGRIGRESDTRLAEIFLQRLPHDAERIRQLSFLRAMHLWNDHDRNAAYPLFEKVLQAGRDDLPDAIAAHLVGVHIASHGEYETAILYLRRSAAYLRATDDDVGLMWVLTSLGGVEREAFSRSVQSPAGGGSSAQHATGGFIVEDEEHFEAARDALNEALDLARKLDDFRELGWVSLELASIYFRAEYFELAIDLAVEAKNYLNPSDPTYLRSLIILGSLYRSVEDIERAAVTLEEAAQIARETDVAAPSLAQMLNVLASLERKQKSLVEARRHAEMSVSLGRRFSNGRHLAQALHTLSRILIDMANDAELLRVAEERLDESTLLLEASRDARGLAMAQHTRDQLALKQKRLALKRDAT